MSEPEETTPENDTPEEDTTPEIMTHEIDGLVDDCSGFICGTYSAQ
jgi:hypothetical protein